MSGGTRGGCGRRFAASAHPTKLSDAESYFIQLFGADANIAMDSRGWRRSGVVVPRVLLEDRVS
jgi:hypothetical protein